MIYDYYSKTKSGLNINLFKPYSYQKEVAEVILNGENIILQAPTGAGKTLGSIMPFIIAKEEKLAFPNKLIYSTPRRTLVNSLYKDIVEEITEGNFNNEFDITIQTGERKEDKYFNGDLVFTTFDQSLSSALSMPISLSNRLGNINVAAILSSYLIFDEFHLFDLQGSYTTTVLLLEKLKEIVPFCIMTATLSKKRTRDLADKLDARVIRADDKYYLKDIISQKGKERKIHVDINSLNAEKIVYLHNKIDNESRSKKSIVMCNRVDNAQKIYKDLKNILSKKNNDIKLILIHSRFLDKDRFEKEEIIKKLLSKSNNESNVILVSTQVIEVGIDITSDIMHTEISSIDSFLQRIGRCARYQNEKGEVYVYDVLNEGENKYLPYDEEVTLKTFEYLKNINNNFLTPEKSQEIIDKIYSEETNIDSQIKEITEITSSSFINESWKSPDKNRFKDLIRDIVGCNIIIKNWIKDGDSPYNFQSLNISPWTLRSKIKKIANKTESWLVKQVIERSDESEYKYTYRTISAVDIYANELYLLNSQFFAYNKEIGLLFNETGSVFERLPKNLQENDFDNIYKEESFLQHINSIKKEIPKLIEEICYLIDFIKISFELDDQQLNDIVELTIWAHDLGKLQDNWQSAHKKSEYRFIAHGERIKKPPGHAGESFWIALSVIEDYVFDFIKKKDVIIDIIAKSLISHHSIKLNKVNSYEISDDAKKYLEEINDKFFSNIKLKKYLGQKMDKLFLKLNLGEEINDLSEQINIRTTEEYLFYFLLIRVLRLADQRATKKLNQ